MARRAFADRLVLAALVKPQGQLQRVGCLAGDRVGDDGAGQLLVAHVQHWPPSGAADD